MRRPRPLIRHRLQPVTEVTPQPPSIVGNGRCHGPTNPPPLPSTVARRRDGEGAATVCRPPLRHYRMPRRGHSWAGT
jgi:hypothetical protein